ncbi:MAG: FAD-binding protein [Rhodobacteraceae bacterium]|nr:FAD-binding protein [Paracoccaceae bacterium]
MSKRLPRSLSFLNASTCRFMCWAGGSNCLLPKRLRAVVAMMAIKGWCAEDSVEDHIRIKAQAGEDWPSLVAQITGASLGGLENLAGIPGTAGAAPIQNIDAYGVELSDVFERLKAYDRKENRMVMLDKADCRFAYRHSVFKDQPGRCIVSEVTQRLPRLWHPILSYAGLRELPPPQTPATVMQAVLAQRAAKLPDWRVLGHVGSFFQNPVVSEEMWRALPEMPGIRPTAV